MQRYQSITVCSENRQESNEWGGYCNMTQERARELMKTQKEAYMYNIRKMIDELYPARDARSIIQIYTMLKAMKEHREARCGK